MGLLRNCSYAVIKRTIAFIITVAMLVSVFACKGTCYISAAEDLDSVEIIQRAMLII